MIHHFGTIYVGTADLDDMGATGTPVNERRLSNEALVAGMRHTEELAVALDQNGFDTLFLAEHHFQPEGYELIPNVLMMSVHLAHLTRSLRFGSAFNISPMWHPLRLAEDFALADILTGGRVSFGVARGYHVREVETLGGPLLDGDANRELFEEQVEVLHKAFHQESFSHDGVHYDLPPRLPYRGYELRELSLVPRPLTQPVDIWTAIVSGNQRGFDLMFRFNMRGLLSGGLGQRAEENLSAYRDAAARHGHDWVLGQNLRLQVTFHMADSQRRAVAEATPWWEENVKFFGPLNFVAGLKPHHQPVISQRNSWAGHDIPTLQDQVDAHSYFCGSPEEFVDYLREIERRYPGLEAVNVNHAYAAPKDRMLEQLEWFASDVMPHFGRVPEAVAVTA